MLLAVDSNSYSLLSCLLSGLFPFYQKVQQSRQMAAAGYKRCF